ncbi:MAG: hypothetical protein ABSC22_00370 [Roseiarcus sp.]|jgi:hypothetical protein
MTDYVTAWQCIGCGRIEAPQPCIGVCRDRKVRFAYADEHEEVLALARRAEQQSEALKTLVRKLAFTTPRDGEWEQCFRALQREARLAMTAPRSAQELPSTAIG